MDADPESGPSTVPEAALNHVETKTANNVIMRDQESHFGVVFSENSSHREVQRVQQRSNTDLKKSQAKLSYVVTR